MASPDIFSVIDDIDIFLTNINGEEIELSRLVLNIEFFESIFSHFLSGKILIADTLDILQNFIIIGNEELAFNIHTSESDSSLLLTFRIYKINHDVKVSKGDDKKKLYELYFCSKEAIDDKLKSVSKKLSGSPESIVQDMILNELSSDKLLFYDTSSNSLDIYSNNWKPSKVFDFTSKLAKTSSYSDFIFYETLQGFSFKTISGLLNESSVDDIIFNTNTDSFIGNNNIRMYKFDRYFDVMTNAKNALFGRTFYTPSDTDYSYTKTEVSLDENYDNIVSAGARKHFNSDLSSYGNMVSTNFYDPEVSKIRLASLDLLTNYRASIRLNGDFGRIPGDILSLSFPNIDNEKSMHKNFNGNWIILEIRHMINQPNIYTQNILVAKNAFFNNTDLPQITTKVNA